MPSWDDVVAIATALPDVQVSTSYGTPALKVRGRLFARLRTEAEGGLMLRCTAAEKAALLAAADPAFFTTPHYAGHDSILVDLKAVDPGQLAELVAEAWWLRAPVTVRRKRPEPGTDASG